MPLFRRWVRIILITRMAFRRVHWRTALLIGVLIVIGLVRPLLSIRAQVNSAAMSTAAALSARTIPASDRIDLARRFLGITGSFPIPTTSLHVYQVGDTATFWVEDNTAQRKFQIDARLLYATPHVFMWFDTRTQPDLNAVRQAADTFENQIYPTVHRYFGSERSPGIDGDVHIYIVNARGIGSSILGYFVAADTYPTAVVRTSNQHNMLLMSFDNGTVDSRQYLGTIAHEFQHMVHNALHPNQETWLNEGLSEVSRLLNHYADSSFAGDFLYAPQTQLNAWQPDQGAYVHYGAGYLFGAYFVQRFGANNLHTLISDPGLGLAAFDDVLPTIQPAAPGKTPLTTTDLFADWQAANLLADPTLADGRYGYQNFPETLRPAQISGPLLVGSHDETTHQYGTRYLELTTPGTYTLRFSGPSAVRVVPISAHSGSHFWWGGRTDGSDTRLTHRFDLSGVRAATLDFWTAYAIEDQFDYGYVTLSTDGGQTWKAFATPQTSTANPNDQAYGPGYTGVSGRASSATNDSGKADMTQPPQWIEQKIDLSAYAGQSILIRFEYITDDAVTYAGFALDDISIPEIGYHSDAESGDDGWQAEGWARIDGQLPQTYLIQQISSGRTPSGTTVTRLLSRAPADSASATAVQGGPWTITVNADTPRVVIAVAGMTRFTYEPALFHYNLEIAR